MASPPAPSRLGSGPLSGGTGQRGLHVTVRAALMAGFAVVVALWLAAVADLALRVRDVDRALTVMTDRFIRVEDALETVRNSVLLAAIDWRDAFLDTGGRDRTDFYRAQLLDYRAQCEARLAELRGEAALGMSAEDVAALAREIDAYWASVLPLLEMAPLSRAVEARRLLNERVLPKRALVVRIAQQAQQLNRVRFQRQQREIAALYAQAQRRVAVTGGLATLLSLVVGAVVVAHVSRLERRLRAELAANAANTADLHRLSARLVRAQEDERRSIARELHDEVGQALTAAKLQLALATRAAPGDRGPIDEARAIVDGALQSARHLSRLLHPPMLDDMGLAPAVEWYLRGFAARTGIDATLEHVGMDIRAAPEVETCLFRVVQETTTNVVRHAGARACRVYLQRLPSSVVLTIEDDGRGFDAAAARSGRAQGLGLLGIEERVSGFRGTFRLESEVGRGTRITVELPALSELRERETPAAAAGSPDADRDV